MAKTEEGLNLLKSVYTKFLVKYYASNHSPLPINWFKMLFIYNSLSN